MPLIYSFVARGMTVLAEYTTYSGNFKSVALECLQSVSNPESKFTINCDRHTFNFLNDGDFIYLAVAEESYGRTIPFGFLQRVSEDFQRNHGAKAITGAEGSFDKIFGPSLKNHMEYCQEHPEEISKIASVQKKVDEVKDVMVKNIEQVLERGEKIDNLVTKTDDLRHHAAQFQHQGQRLRSKMWWQNFKMKATIAAVVVCIILILFLIICFSGDDCV
eukprot:g5865.t1